MSFRRFNWTSLALLAVLSLAGPPDASAKNGRGGGKPQPEPDGVPFAVIDIGQFSGVGTAQNVTVTSEADWNVLWAQHAGGVPPAVDFSQNIVVSVFLGPRASTAYSVRIDRIGKAHLTCSGCGDLFTYHVEYVEEELQGKHCAFSDIITTPYVIAEVARPELLDIVPELAMPTYAGTKVIGDCRGGPKDRN
jgi:hypothetical protein